MRPKLAAAIITGTMARPSSPSVRFTALPAPTMMKAPNTTKNQPRSITKSLKNGNRQRGRERAAAEARDARSRPATRDDRLDEQASAAGEAGMASAGDLEIVVVEADDAEAERHAEHDPDVGVGRIGPEQRGERRGRTGSSARPWWACRSWSRGAIAGRRRGSAGPCPGATRRWSMIHGPNRRRRAAPSPSRRRCGT